jgi:hypothetical protein
MRFAIRIGVVQDCARNAHALAASRLVEGTYCGRPAGRKYAGLMSGLRRARSGKHLSYYWEVETTLNIQDRGYLRCQTGTVRNAHNILALSTIDLCPTSLIVRETHLVYLVGISKARPFACKSMTL